MMCDDGPVGFKSIMRYYRYYDVAAMGSFFKYCKNLWDLEGIELLIVMNCSSELVIHAF